MAARLPFDRLFDHLRAQDTHPPLDYLLRAPLARAGVSAVGLRLPSFVFSCGALALFAWWMRARGLAGVVATVIARGSAFQIYHGGEARMYAVAGAARSRRGDGRGALALRRTRPAGARGRRAASSRVRCSTTCRGSSSPRAWSRSRDSASTAARGNGAPRSVRRSLVWAALWGTSFVEQAGGDWVRLDPAHDTAPASPVRCRVRSPTWIRSRGSSSWASSVARCASGARTVGSPGSGLPSVRCRSSRPR